MCYQVLPCEIIGFDSATQQGSAFNKQTAYSKRQFKRTTLCWSTKSFSGAWERTSLRRNWFPFFFDVNFSRRTFGGETGNFFFRVSRAFWVFPLSHHQMSFGNSSRPKKWKPASPKARPFSCTRKTLRTPERYKNRPWKVQYQEMISFLPPLML